MSQSNLSDIEISTDKSRLDINIIHSFLSNSYWAKGRTKDKTEKAIENSLCFGMYKNGKQIGFARVVTDYSIFAYLADVFVLEEYRGNGAGQKMLNAIFNYADLKGIKKWMLATNDAHGLYAKFGFNLIKNPEKYMEYLPQETKK